MTIQRTLAGIALGAGLLGLAVSASATPVFFDDFEGANPASNYTFVGVNPGAWNVATGAGGNNLLQSTSIQAGHAGAVGFGLINGVTTSDHFRISAQMQAVGDVPNRSDPFGHVGFVWGFSDLANFNTAYARMHSGQVTHWNRNGGAFSGETIFMPGGSTLFASADAPSLGAPQFLGLSLEVDYINRVMTTMATINGTTFTRTYTGGAFDQINQNSGGSVGVVGFGERVAYDNLRYQDLTAVPAPGALGLLGVGLLLVSLTRRR